MAPIYEKWKQEDAAELAPMRHMGQKNMRQYQQTGDHIEYMKRQQEIYKQMSIEIPAQR